MKSACKWAIFTGMHRGIVATAALVILLFAASSALAWSAPLAAPPDSNAAGPINISSAPQGKTGWLGLGLTNPFSQLQVGSELAFMGLSYPSVSFNAYYDSSWHYLASGDWAAIIQQDSQNGGLLFEVASNNTGSAGSAAALSPVMTVSSAGVIGTTGDVCILNANGSNKLCLSSLLTRTCTFNGRSIASGQSVTAYAYSSDTSCPSQTRTCKYGKLSGSYAYSSCSIVYPTSQFVYWTPWAQGIYCSVNMGTRAASCTALPNGSGVTQTVQSASMQNTSSGYVDLVLTISQSNQVGYRITNTIPLGRIGATYATPGPNYCGSNALPPSNSYATNGGVLYAIYANPSIYVGNSAGVNRNVTTSLAGVQNMANAVGCEIYQ